MATQQEAMQKLMYSLDTANTTLAQLNQTPYYALNQAINYATGGKFKTINAAITKMLNDRKKAKSADDFLKTYCGINLDSNNKDTGAITGSDAGGSKVKTATSVVPESGKASTFTGTSFTVNGLTVKLGKAYNKLSNYEKYVWSNLHEHWIKNALNLISESYGSNFSFNTNSSVREITITFSENVGYDPFLTSPTFAASDKYRKKPIGLSLNINLAYYKTDTVNYNDLDGKPNGLGILYGIDYLDRNIAHELTHAVMYANIDYLAVLPRMFLEGMAELTHGIDDTRTADLKALAADSTKLQAALNDAAQVSGISSPRYAGGYMFLRWLAKRIANSTSTTDINTIDNSRSNISVTGGEGKDSIYSNGSNVTINALGGNDSVTNFGSSVTIYGGAGKDYLYSGASKVFINGGDGDDSIDNRISSTYAKIDGGAGNDTIWNTANSVTISGGIGNDSIQNYNGKNVLFGYKANDGNDKIIGFNATSTLSISGGTYTSQKSGSDVLVTVGKNKVTLTGTASLSKVNIVGTKVATLLTVTDSTKSPVTVDSAVKVINASKRTTAVKITGNSLANTINGGSNKDTIYGEAGNDSILGNASNDSLFGGAGNDYLDGGEGHDSISGGDGHDSLYGSAGNDILWSHAGNDYLNGGTGNDYLDAGDGNDTLNGGSGRDTLWGGKGKDILWGYEDDDKLYGQGDDDKLYGHGGNDSLFGDVGNDYLDGGEGHDSISGGDGHDSLYGSAGNDILWSHAGNDYLNGGTGNDYLDASDGNDSLNGGSGRDTLWGGKGKDILWGYEDDDKLYGQDDDDKLYGHGGNDYLDGGAGNDYLDGGDSNDTLWGGANNDTLYGGNGNDSLSGGKSIDKIYGGKGKDTVWGNEGNDIIYGGADNDIILGHEDNDKLYGEAGNDKLYGGKGNDSLWGGKGNDSLWGEDGKDTFLYENGDGKDIIFGFANDDMLKITGTFSTNYNKSKKEVYIKVGSTSNAITLKNFSATNFNVNNVNYKLGSSSLVKK